MADTSINLSDIAAEMLDVATDNRDHILEEVYGLGENESDEANGIGSMAEYTTTYDTPNEVILTKITGHAAWMPGGHKTATGKTFNPMEDAVSFKPRKMRVEHIAQNYVFTQADFITLKKSYLFAIQRGNIKADEVPFAMWVFRALTQVSKEELRTAYDNAVHNAQGTNYLALFDGWQQQKDELILSGDIPSGNITEHAAITATNAVSVFEKLVSNVPTKFLGKVVARVSREQKKFYEADFLTRYGTVPFNTGINKTTIQGTGIVMLVEPSLDGATSPEIITRGNLARGYDGSSNNVGLDIEHDKSERAIHVMLDAQAGAGVTDPTQWWLGDVEGSAPPVVPDPDPESGG